MLRGLRLRMYWDGSETPAVDVPFGDFFCHNVGRMATFENVYFSSPEGRSFNCVIPMPFQTGMKIVVTNESGTHLSALYYEVNYTLGDAHPPETLYFHAHWNRENPTTFGRDFELLPKIEGRGRFLGVNVGVVADTGKYFKSWWGEGEVKIFLDGDTQYSTLCGTGTEDYIGTGWGQGQYANLYQGCHLADHEAFEYAFYRFHTPDPIYFHSDIRVTIQQIGCWDPSTIGQLHGKGNPLFHGDAPIDTAAAVEANSYGLFERQDDWSSCAYFFLGGRC
jgi:hypothetical protein